MSKFVILHNNAIDMVIFRKLTSNGVNTASVTFAFKILIVGLK